MNKDRLIIGGAAVLVLVVGALVLLSGFKDEEPLRDLPATHEVASTEANKVLAESAAVPEKQEDAEIDASASSHEAESLEALDKRMKIYPMYLALKNGRGQALSSLPAKGYKNGILGVLNKYHVYANPAYSFADCDEDKVITETGSKPGCVVSLKLARKLPDGTYQDNGIRIEYAVGLGEKQFIANNSAYAQHVIDGDGWLENQLAE